MIRRKLNLSTSLVYAHVVINGSSKTIRLRVLSDSILSAEKKICINEDETIYDRRDYPRVKIKKDV